MPDWPVIVRNGSVGVTIYRQVRGPYVSFIVAYSLSGKRTRASYADEATARSDAQKIADLIAAGQHAGLQLRGDDHVHYSEAVRHVTHYGVTIAQACAEYADARRILGPAASIVEAAKEYVRRHGALAARVTVADAVDRMLAQEESNQQNGRKVAWVKLLRTHVKQKFAGAFQTYVTSIDSREINAWLSALKVSERTKANIRDCVSHFFRWCRGQGLLPRDADPMDGVADFRKRRIGPVSIMVARELAKLMPALPGELVPYAALRAFAGLRDKEACLIDWRDIDVASEPDSDGYWGWITITETVAKQTDSDNGVRRLVPIRGVLREWLLPHVKRNGPVSSYVHMQRKVVRVAETVGVTMKRNVLRHSYISYAVAESEDIERVANQSGNTPAIIRQNYLRRVRPTESVKWFAVAPTPKPDSIDPTSPQYPPPAAGP
jgi:integrase